MFWSSNGWRCRNHSFHFCKVYVSLTARILTGVVVSQLEHERKNPEMLLDGPLDQFPFPGYSLGALIAKGGKHKDD